MLATQRKPICESCEVPTDQYRGVILTGKVTGLQFFVCDYCYERNLHIAVYCEHCGVVAVEKGDKYCVGCVNDIVDSLAMEYQESVAVEKGWI